MTCGSVTNANFELQTERLSLRDPVLSDVTALASYHSHELYLQHYDQPPDTQSIIELAVDWASQNPRENYQLIVEVVGGSKVIGCAGLRQVGCPINEAEVGVEIHPDHWGKGYATETLVALVDLARRLGLLKLYALTNISNRRAIELTEKMGFDLVKIDANVARLSLSLESIG